MCGCPNFLVSPPNITQEQYAVLGSMLYLAGIIKFRFTSLLERMCRMYEDVLGFWIFHVSSGVCFDSDFCVPNAILLFELSLHE